MTATPCPVCGADRWEPVLRVSGVPVTVGTVLSSKAAALDVPRGEIELAICDRCGLVHNLAFDPAVVDYTDGYDSSQFFSDTFTRYARGLVERLIARYDLVGSTVVDIGCGKGELLAIFLEQGAERCIGVDPAYGGEQAELERSGRLQVVRDLYRGRLAEAGVDVGLWSCRHVLEHVTEPADLLTSIKGDSAGTGAIYLEVPNGEFVLSDSGLWDVIYPHVSYFTAPSLRMLAERCGIDVLVMRLDFGGQFLALEGRPDHGRATVTDGESVESVRRHAAVLAERFEHSIGRWNAELGERRGRGTTALWGAGSRGVTFLNTTVAGEIVDVVVDINPRKHGSYIPGTGQQIVGPESLRDLRPATVVVMNQNYEPEIRAELDALGLHPEVACA